jgi:hypothetical protein
MAAPLQWVAITGTDDASRKRERRQTVRKHVMREFMRKKKETEESRPRARYQPLTIRESGNKGGQCITPPDEDSPIDSSRSVSPPVQRCISAALDPFDSLPIQNDPYVAEAASFCTFLLVFNAVSLRITTEGLLTLDGSKVVFCMPALMPDQYESNERTYADLLRVAIKSHGSRLRVKS